MSQYKPPFTITDKIHRLKSQIIKNEKSVKIHIHATKQMLHNAHLHSVHSTLAIENISLTLEEVADIIDGNYVPCTPNEIRAVKNAYEAYNLLNPYHPPNPYSTADMLHIHRTFCFNTAKFVPRQVDNLLEWVKTSDEHPLIKSSAFHYEIMSLRPFSIGNGLVARLWQLLLLYKWSMPLGMPLASAICKRKQEYFGTLAIPNKATGSTKFIEYMLQAIKDAVLQYDKQYLTL